MLEKLLLLLILSFSLANKGELKSVKISNLCYINVITDLYKKHFTFDLIFFLTAVSLKCYECPGNLLTGELTANCLKSKTEFGILKDCPENYACLVETTGNYLSIFSWVITECIC